MNRALAGLLLLTLALPGCAAPLQNGRHPEDSTNTQTESQSQPASVMFQRMMSLSDETARFHGGQWTHGNEEATPWNVGETAGYLSERCPGSKEFFRYVNTLYGPAVEDPEAAVEEYVAHFEQQGFTEYNRFDAEVAEKFGSGWYIIVSVQDAEGTKLIYQAGTHLSSVTVEGACSDDPAMDIRTT